MHFEREGGDKRMIEKINALIEQSHNEMINIRRDLHMYPELSEQEVRTPEFIAKYQKSLGNSVQAGVGGRGIVATLKGGKPGKTVALRADFDALPIQEENDVPYKSRIPGVMHACGHDAHTAIVLGVAKALIEVKNELPGNVVFIHQHAEETLKGAKGMVEDGCLENVDAIYATHMENNASVGEIHYAYDYILGSSDSFEIEIFSEGGHAAFPHTSADPVVIGSQLVSNLQQIVSRKVEPLKPAVVTLGSFNSGFAHNVISNYAKITGTIRTFDEEVRNNIINYIKEITSHTCTMYKATHKVNIVRGTPSTKNSKEETDVLISAAKKIVGHENVIAYEKNLGAEDFSYFLNEVPGSYFFTGSANEDKGIIYPYHHPKFDIDENALLIGAKTLATTAIKYLINNVDDCNE